MNEFVNPKVITRFVDQLWLGIAPAYDEYNHEVGCPDDYDHPVDPQH